MNIVYCHEGLSQETEMNYNMINCKRIICDTNYMFTRSLKLHLPLFLTIPLWKRHGYSMSDIHVTLEFFSSIHLWQCALLLGISASNSAIKLAFSTPESMVYGSKAIVIRKIEKILQESFDFDTIGSVLDKIRDDHIPPLPIHSIDTSVFQTLCQYVPTQPFDMLNLIVFDDLFMWNGIKVVPLWIEKGALYCVRIIDRTVFDDSKRVKKDCLSTRPLNIKVGSDHYAGIEEAMFFVPSASPKQIIS
jgi:hypothetical protein